MNKFVKKGAFMLLIAGLTMGVASCSDDDPDYTNVTPPEVEVAPNTLTGVITGISGEAIANATVTLGTETAKSDANGVYLFSDVKTGTFSIKAEAEGKLPKEGEITVEDLKKSQSLVWNAVLAMDVKEEVAVSKTEETSGSVETETMKDNEKAKVNVEANIPADAVESTEEDVKIILAPIYDAGSAIAKSRSVTRAEEPTMLVGANLSCNKTEVALKKTVELGFSMDDEVAQSVVAKQFKGGQWVTVKSSVKDGKVIIEASEFAAYGLFLGVSFTSSNGSEAISFETAKWDNLYGAKDMSVGSANYTYKVGTEIKTKGTSVLTALLIEKLAQRFGATVSTVNGSYPLNVTLPIGTVMTISGVQSKQNVSVSAIGKTVSGTNYGTVSIVVSTANRSHTGSSN